MSNENTATMLAKYRELYQIGSEYGANVDLASFIKEYDYHRIKKNKYDRLHKALRKCFKQFYFMSKEFMTRDQFIVFISFYCVDCMVNKNE